MGEPPTRAHKEWRPPEWEYPYDCVDLLEEKIKSFGRSQYGAGADAMLKAIREKLGKMAFLLDDEEVDFDDICSQHCRDMGWREPE